MLLSIIHDGILWKSFSGDRGKFGSKPGWKVLCVYACVASRSQSHRRYTPTQSPHTEYLSSPSRGGNTWPIAMQIEKSKLKWMKNLPLVCSSSSICHLWCILSLPARNRFIPSPLRLNVSNCLRSHLNLSGIIITDYHSLISALHDADYEVTACNFFVLSKLVLSTRMCKGHWKSSMFACFDCELASLLRWTWVRTYGDVWRKSAGWEEKRLSVWLRFSTLKFKHKRKDFRGERLTIWCWHVWVYIHFHNFHNNRLYNPFHNSHPSFGAYISYEGCLGRPTSK